jgi:predicted CoA-substrate-specific enzyme activase
MAISPPIFAGADVGASRTKVVLLDQDKNIIGRDVRHSGTDFAASARAALARALETAGSKEADIARAVSTGYGRKNVAFAGRTRTEISCHARGCYYYFPMAMTIIDIGGQDNKIIKLDRAGRRVSFKMNRKCAAGTGAFLEEMSTRLAIPLEDLDGLAGRADGMVELGSFCTVFSATEVLERIREGAAVPDIVKGLFYSVVKRVMEMDILTERVVMTGGVVAHNPYLVKMVEETLGREIGVPEHPQFTGAVGAALFAVDGETAPSG